MVPGPALKLVPPTARSGRWANSAKDAAKPDLSFWMGHIDYEAALNGITLKSSGARDRLLLEGHNHHMNEITREQLTASLSALEERLDRRIERIETAGDRRADDARSEIELRDEQVRRELDLRQEAFRIEQAIRDKAMEERFSGFLAAQAERDKRIDGSLTLLADSQREIKGSIGSMRSTIIVTAITTVAAIVIGIGGFNAMLTSNMVASFQMGRSELALQKQQESQPAPTAAPVQPTQQK